MENRREGRDEQKHFLEGKIVIGLGVSRRVTFLVFDY